MSLRLICTTSDEFTGNAKFICQHRRIGGGVLWLVCALCSPDEGSMLGYIEWTVQPIRCLVSMEEAVLSFMELLQFMVAGCLASWILTVGAEELKLRRACEFPAVYNFGDSNSDTGATSAAFFPRPWPSGETFFHRPVGRVCDGRLIIDFIAEELKLPYLSPYLDSIGTIFRYGANFATGGSAIRQQNESFLQSSPFSLDVQIAQFDNFKARTGNLYNQTSKKPSPKKDLPRPKDFPKAIYLFDIGQNDLAAGFRKLSNSQLLAAIPDILNQFAIAVQHLYELQGARTFWIHNTGPIGCLPFTLLFVNDPMPGFLDQYGCVKAQNDMAVEFNKQLKDKVIQLRTQLPHAVLTYVDVYAAKIALISNAKNQGFVDPMKICCGYHENGVHVGCGGKLVNINNGSVITGNACKDPSSYISWDGIHFTEAANRWIAKHILQGSLSDPPIPISNACISS